MPRPKPKKSKKNTGRKPNKGKKTGSQPYVPTRVRQPREGELFGIVTKNFGNRRFEVACEDKKIRNVRIPGRIHRRYRIRVDDVIIFEPWYGLQEDEKGDLQYRYLKSQLRLLARSKRARMFLEEMNVPIPDQMSFYGPPHHRR